MMMSSDIPTERVPPSAIPDDDDLWQTMQSLSIERLTSLGQTLYIYSKLLAEHSRALYQEQLLPRYVATTAALTLFYASTVLPFLEQTLHSSLPYMRRCVQHLREVLRRSIRQPTFDSSSFLSSWKHLLETFVAAIARPDEVVSVTSSATAFAQGAKRWSLNLLWTALTALLLLGELHLVVRGTTSNHKYYSLATLFLLSSLLYRERLAAESAAIWRTVFPEIIVLTVLVCGTLGQVGNILAQWVLLGGTIYHFIVVAACSIRTKPELDGLLLPSVAPKDMRRSV